jgi:hypothetical protein
MTNAPDRHTRTLLKSISTPDKVESRLGTLEFDDGAPSAATAEMLYDGQTRSMLQTDQPKPDVGSQSGTVEANPDGSTDVYFGPKAPDGKANNWIQTVPGKGFFAILRLYNPLQPFFDKAWRPSEIELM